MPAAMTFSDRVAGVLLALLVCTAPAVRAEGEPDADAVRRARAECAAAATRVQTINVGTGVYTEQARVQQPLEIRIPAGKDVGDFRSCLEARGIAVDVGEDRYLQAIEACRDERRERIGYRIAAARPGTIGGDDGFAACVQRRVGGIEVEIEAIGEEGARTGGEAEGGRR
ncbi:MAG TPA: hypothetical protein DCY89_07580 [Gammaproteobacteria bacterium]|nr:hypothetical protein [Gammaproteobacteria bacterium]